MQNVNSVGQHILLFLQVGLTSGTLFCWIVYEIFLDAHKLPGAKYNGYGFMTCVVTYIVSSILFHVKLLAVLLRKMSFRTINICASCVFILGMVCVILGGMFVPELLFVAEILISSSGALLYVMQFVLFGAFKFHSVIMSVAFATSTLLLQIVDIPIQFWIPLTVWIVCVCVVMLLYNPQSEKLHSHQSTFSVLSEAFKLKELYKLYVNCLFSIGVKCYYQNSYFNRLKSIGVDPATMAIVFSASNFTSVVAGLFNFMELSWAHVFFSVMAIAFEILIILEQNAVIIGINLFLMNISATGIITSSLCLCNKHNFEASSFVYFSMLLGDMCGFIPFSRLADYVLAAFALTSQSVSICLTTLNKLKQCR